MRTGTSWRAFAFLSLALAFTALALGDPLPPDTIWVSAKTTYTGSPCGMDEARACKRLSVGVSLLRPNRTLVAVLPGTYTEYFEIQVNAKSISVLGVGGAGATIFDCKGAKQAFWIMNGGANMSVSFEGMTFKDCTVQRDGGALAIENFPSVSISHCDFINCTAQGYGSTYTGFGGGVSILNAASVSVHHSSFQRNFLSISEGTSSGGAGLAIRHSQQFDAFSIHVSHCHFTGNDAHPSFGGGLGIWLSTTAYQNDSSRLVSIKDSTFQGNKGRGGVGFGIKFSNGNSIQVAVSNVTVTNNLSFESDTATTRAGGGGVSFVAAGTATNISISVDKSSFSFNNASNIVTCGGGMLFNFGQVPGSSFVVRETKFEANSASSGSALAFMFRAATPTNSYTISVTGCSFINNTQLKIAQADTYGALLIDPSVSTNSYVEVSGSVFDGNSCDPSIGTGCAGPALALLAPPASAPNVTYMLSNNTFNNNRKHAVIPNPTCGTALAVIEPDNGPLPSGPFRNRVVIQDSRFTNNTSTGPGVTYGGGVCFIRRFSKGNSATFMSYEVTGNVFVGNSATIGGGVFFEAEECVSDFSLFNNTFVANKALMGGAVTFFSNMRVLSFPPIVCTPWTLTIRIAGLVCHNNSASGGGCLAASSGGVEIEWVMNITDSEFIANKAIVGDGGAIGINSNVDTFLYIDKSRFERNTALVGAGGAIVLRGGPFQTFMSSCSFFANKANTVNEISAGVMTFHADDTILLQAQPGVATNIITTNYFNILHPPDMQCVDGASAEVASTRDSGPALNYLAQFYTASCVSCFPGYYNFSHGGVADQNVTHLACAECPFGAICKGGTEVYAGQQFWGSVDSMGALHMENCPSGYCCDQLECEFSYCANNRTGVLCGKCREGYSETLGTSGSCRLNGECQTWETAVYALVVLGLSVVYPLVLLIFPHGKYGYFKVALNFFQVLPIVTSFHVDSGAYFLMKPLSDFFSLKTSGISTYGLCPFVGLEAEDKTLLGFSGPLGAIVFSGLLLIAMAITHYIRANRLRNQHLPVSDDEAEELITREAPKEETKPTKGPLYNSVAGFITVVLMGYTMANTTALSLIRCTSLILDKEPELRLFTAGETKCFQPWQYTLMVLSGLVIIPLPVILEVIRRTLVRKEPRISRPGKPDVKTIVAKAYIDTFSRSYRSEMAWWELVVMYRRLGLVVVDTFIPDKFFKAFAVTTLCFGIFSANLFAKPFKTRTVTAAESISLGLLFILSLMSLRESTLESIGVVEPFPSVQQAFFWSTTAFFVVVLLVVIAGLARSIYAAIRKCKNKRAAKAEEEKSN